MDEKYIENIDNLAANVEDLIAYLEEVEQRKNEDKDRDRDINLASFESVQTEFSTFNKFLQDIKNENVKTNTTLSAYLQKVEDLDTKDIDPIDDKESIENIDNINPVNNFDIELESFNNNLLEMLDKFENIKESIEQLGIEYDLNISEESILEIREKLNNNLVLDLSIDNVDDLNNLSETISDISSSVESLNFIDIGVDFSTWVDDLNLIKENLESISELDLENINFDVFADDNIDQILEKIETLKDVQIEVDVKTDLDNIDLLLNKIKEIDLERLRNLDIMVGVGDLNIDDIKDDIENTLEGLNDISYIEIDLKLKDDIQNRLSEIQTQLDEFVSQLPPLVITSEVGFKTEADQILEDLEDQIADVDITIKPNIDLSEQIEQLNEDGIGLDIESNIVIDTSEIQKIMDNMPTVQESNSESLEKQDLIIQSLQNNNEILQSLNDNIVNILNPVSNVETVTGDSGVGVVDETTTVATVSPKDKDDGLSEEAKLLKQVADGIGLLIKTNDGLRLEMLKSTFNNKLDI